MKKLAKPVIAFALLGLLTMPFAQGTQAGASPNSYCYKSNWAVQNCH